MIDRATVTRVYVGLLFLTGLTVGLSFLGSSRSAAVMLALAVASFKAGLIGWHFMDMKKAPALVHATVAVGVIAVVILAVGLLPDVGGKW